MAGVVEWIKAFAVSLGGPGLFIIAFLDSSFLSFPEVNDLLIIWLTTQHKERMVYYAAMTTLGSVAGCLALYTARPQGRRSVSEKAVQPAVSRAGDGHLPPLRPAGDPDSVDPPAADTLQDFRARGRRGEGAAAATSSSPSQSAGASGTSEKVCWRSTTAITRQISSTRTRTSWRWSSAPRRSCLAWRGSWLNAGANAQPFDDRAQKPL